MHLLAIPITQSYKGKVMFQMVRQVLCGLFGPGWSNKMVSIANNGTANITGRFAGASSLSGSIWISGFYRI